MYRKNFPGRKETRRLSAKLREAERNSLSLADKIAKSLPGSKERLRLVAKGK